MSNARLRAASSTLAVLIAVTLLAACSSTADDAPDAGPRSIASTVTASPAPDVESTAAATATAAATPIATATQLPADASPVPTSAATLVATSSPVSTPTPIATPTPTAQPTPTQTPTATAAPQETPGPTTEAGAPVVQAVTCNASFPRPGQSVFCSAEVVPDNSTVTWEAPLGVADPAGNSISIVWWGVGARTVTATACNEAGCDSAQSTVQVTHFGRECDSRPDLQFTSHITDLASIRVISQLGGPSGNQIKGHSYLQIGGGATVPVYAPADSELISIGYYTEEGMNQYFLTFQSSCEVWWRFDHVQQVVDAIAAVAPSQPNPDSRSSEVAPGVRFQAGDLIGYSRGTLAAGTFDIGVYDIRQLNQFANGARYAGLLDKLHAACQFDYFAEPLRSQYYALFGVVSGNPLPGAPCGSATQDVPGAAAGAWFANDEDRFELSGQLVLMRQVNDRIDIAGDGFSMSVERNASTWIDPAQVTGDHCYASQGSYLYLRVISDTELAYSRGSGGCPADLPASATTLWR